MAKVLSKLKEIRKSRDMTQDAVSRACNVTTRTIASAEKGLGVSLTTMMHIAKGLKVKTEELI